MRDALRRVYQGLSKLAQIPMGFAPRFAERLCISGGSLRNIMFLGRVKAAPSRGREPDRIEGVGIGKAQKL